MNILEGLNFEQAKAVKHHKGPLLVLAGAGSGKTKVITHRIAYLISEYRVNPWNILALTFTNKAAGEMRSRVDAIVGGCSKDILVGTFHSVCLRILRRYIESIGYERGFTIYDAQDQKTLMREIIKYLGLDPKKYRERAFLNAISSAKDKLISPARYEEEARDNLSRQTYARAYREYEKRLKAANALDFDDLIAKTVQLFNECDEALDYCRNRFKYILVDEYQDTNAAQFKFISLLASTRGEGGAIEHNLCVVGDDDQSIYKFRGANIHNILDFENAYPDARVIKLEENYRSTKNILDAANSVISNNSERKPKALRTKKERGDLIRVSCFANEYDEAYSVANDISNAVSSKEAEYGDFAILYRTNAQSRVFEEKLIEKNIPYKIVGAVNFYQRREIKDMLAYLRVIENGLDDLCVKRIINVPKRGIGLTTIDKLDGYASLMGISFYEAVLECGRIEGIGRAAVKLESFAGLVESLKKKARLRECGVEELIRNILDETGYAAKLLEEEGDAASERIENIEELISKAAAYDKDADEPTLGGFLEEVALVADIDGVDEENDATLLMTLHSAKGLEFPYVYMVGMEEGIFPIYGAIASGDFEEMEEERRLCYVGITRAKKKLSLSCAASRFHNGEQKRGAPSRFLDEMPQSLIARVDKSYTAPERAEVSAGLVRPRVTGKELLTASPYIQKGKPNAKIDYVEGDRVVHVKFGEGVVKALSERSGDYEVCVDFDSGITRKMVASFAKLKKL